MRASPWLLLLLLLASCSSAGGASGSGSGAGGGGGGGSPGGGPTPAECLHDPACTRGMASAHRSKCGGGLPENTLAAVRDCSARGVPMLELDTRQTADGEIVLCHDGDAERITDVEARFPGRTSIDALTAAEVATLRYTDPACEGEGADPDACRIPTLREVLAEPSTATLMLDFKSGDHETLARVVNESGEASRVLFFDASLQSVLAFGALVPDAALMPRVHDAAELQALLADPAFPADAPLLIHGDAGWAEEATALLAGRPLRLYVDVFHLDVGLYAAETAMSEEEGARYLDEEIWPKLDALAALGVAGYGTEEAERIEARLHPEGW